MIVARFAILFTARYPRGIFDFVEGVIRWHNRVVGSHQHAHSRQPPQPLVWSLSTYGVVRYAAPRLGGAPGRRLVVAAAAFSRWPLRLIVHRSALIVFNAVPMHISR